MIYDYFSHHCELISHQNEFFINFLDEGSGGEEEEFDAEVSERSMMFGSSERRKISAEWLWIIQFILILYKFF